MTKEEALELSIQKWERILKREQEDHGANDCALCNLYFLSESEEDDYKDCEGCFIKEETGEDYCKATPYLDYKHKKSVEVSIKRQSLRFPAESHEEIFSENMGLERLMRNTDKAAKAMLDFLISLRGKDAELPQTPEKG